MVFTWWMQCFPILEPGDDSAMTGSIESDKCNTFGQFAHRKRRIDAIAHHHQ
jgi:hypothetical protein